MDQRGQRRPLVDPVPHREVSGALAEEDEDQPENERERRVFQLLALAFVAESHPVLLGPPLHSRSQRRQGILPDGAVQTPVEFDAEVAGFGAEVREAACGQVAGREQGDVGPPFGAEEAEVQLQPLARG